MLGSHFFPNHVLSKLFIIIPEFAVLKILNSSSRVSGGSSMSNFPEEVKDGFFNWSHTIVTFRGPLKPCFFSVEVTKQYLWPCKRKERYNSPYETSSAVQRHKSASKWLHSGFAAEMQLFDSFPAVDVKLQRAAKTLCSSLKRFAAN